jgi:hypothetical protein
MGEQVTCFARARARWAISMADRLGVAVGHSCNLSPRCTRGRCAGEISDRVAYRFDALVDLVQRSPVDGVTSEGASSSADSRRGLASNGTSSSASASMAWRS